MSFNKLIFFCLLLALAKNNITISHCKTCPSYRSEGSLSDAGFNTVKELENIVQSGALEDIGKNLGQAIVTEIIASKVLEDAGKNLGQNVGLGTLIPFQKAV